MATRRRWNEESIRTEIAPIVAELGRMPTRRELTERGLGAAWSAMQRHGGTAAWRKALGAPPIAAAAPVPPTTPAAAAPSPAPTTPVAAVARVAAIPSARANGSRRPSAEDIATRAYFIAEQRGGDPVANWLAAEIELLAA